MFFLCTKRDVKSVFLSRVEVHIPLVEVVQVVTSMALKLVVWKLLKYCRFQKKLDAVKCQGQDDSASRIGRFGRRCGEDGTKTRSRVKVSLRERTEL